MKKEDDFISDARINWKKNLWIAWFGCFLTGASFSLVMPFMALYVRELGASESQVEIVAALAVALTALASAIMSPVWGNLADRYGRKPMMVRASVAMVFSMGGIAVVPNVIWLLILRIATGIFAGYVPNATALVASQVPREKAGYALGTLSTGLVAGNLMGPLMGGAMAEWFGMRNVFLIVGFLLFLVSLVTVFWIQEDFEPIQKGEEMPLSEVLAGVSDRQVLLGLFITSMVIQASTQSVVPILSLYIEHLGQTKYLMIVSGMITSAVGLSSIFSSGFLGKIGDKIGNHRLLLGALVYSLLMYLLCGVARTPLQLGIARFLFGFGTGALLPSVNSLLTKITPKEGISRIFSFNQSFVYTGTMIGPLFGSAVARYLGYRWVFFGTSSLVFFNLIWSAMNFRNYLKVREIA